MATSLRKAWTLEACRSKMPDEWRTNVESTENQDSTSWDQFFLYLDNLLVFCEESNADRSLDFHSAALLFNQLDVTLSVLRNAIDLCVDITCKQRLTELCSCFAEIHGHWLNQINVIGRRTVHLADLGPRSVSVCGPGRPKFIIAEELLENLRNMGCSWTQIAYMLRVSRWTIYHSVLEYGINCSRWSDIDDEQLDEIIRGCISRHGTTTGQSYMIGYVRSLGILVQCDGLRAAINRVDLENTALRWAAVITRRVYSVPWPNSLWHIDGHHSLIRWGFVTHGCIDGFSRMIIFLRRSTNNRADTIMSSFEIATRQFGVPSRVRGDHGGENVDVATFMVRER